VSNIIRTADGHFAGDDGLIHCICGALATEEVSDQYGTWHECARCRHEARTLELSTEWMRRETVELPAIDDFTAEGLLRMGVGVRS